MSTELKNEELEKISEFMETTQCQINQAKHYLSLVDFDVTDAINLFLDDQAHKQTHPPQPQIPQPQTLQDSELQSLNFNQIGLVSDADVKKVAKITSNTILSSQQVQQCMQRFTNIQQFVIQDFQFQVSGQKLMYQGIVILFELLPLCQLADFSNVEEVIIPDKISRQELTVVFNLIPALKRLNLANRLQFAVENQICSPLPKILSENLVLSRNVLVENLTQLKVSQFMLEFSAESFTNLEQIHFDVHPSQNVIMQLKLLPNLQKVVFDKRLSAAARNEMEVLLDAGIEVVVQGDPIFGKFVQFRVMMGNLGQQLQQMNTKMDNEKEALLRALEFTFMVLK